MKPKVPSVVQGQMSREKFCSFGTWLCETFPSFFFFSPTSSSSKKNPIFGFNTPKRDSGAVGAVSSSQKEKRQNILGSVWSSAGWNGWRTAQGSVLWSTWSNIWVCCALVWGTSWFSNSALPLQLPSVELQPPSAQAWVNSHKCLCEVGMERFLIYSGRESHPSFLVFLSSVSSFPRFGFPDNTE